MSFPMFLTDFTRLIINMDDFFEKKDGANSNYEGAAGNDTSIPKEGPAAEESIPEESDAQTSQESHNPYSSYQTQSEYPPHGTQGFGYGVVGENNTPVQNRINYSDILPVKDYKPMSRGLKIFALIMASVILLTGAAAEG